MSGIIRKFTFALGLALIGIALPPLALVAAAQNPDLPLGLDLNGTWELVEHGERLSSANPIVTISHTPSEVRATFVSGAECFDGTRRTHVFTGRLSGQPTLPPTWYLSGSDMWVCSGSSGAVKQCKGGIPSNYTTTFKNATVTEDFIEGDRVSQGYKDCAPHSASNGTARFTLERLQPCELERRALQRREQPLLDVVVAVLAARPDFRAAIQAAEQRYGASFNGLPTTTLVFPYVVVGGSWDADIELAEEFVADALPEALASPEWAAAKKMAQDMATAASPLQAAVRMLEQIQRIESGAMTRQSALTEFRNARTQLESCVLQ
jgi:hypothetical protein